MVFSELVFCIAIAMTFVSVKAPTKCELLF